MKRYLVALGCIFILNCWGCALTTQLNTEEYAKLSTLAVLTDSSVTQSNRAIDINENQNAAIAVMEMAKIRLAEMGLMVNALENIVTVGSIYRDEARFILKNKAERKLSGQDNGIPPPYFIGTLSFQDKKSQLTKLFQNLYRPLPEIEMGSEPRPQEQGSYKVPYIKDLGLSSDAALIIKMNGDVYGREEIITEFATNVVLGLLTRTTPVSSMNDSAYMELFLLNIRTGEVLWTATFSGGNPSADIFNEKLDTFLNNLPSVKKAGSRGGKIFQMTEPGRIKI